MSIYGFQGGLPQTAYGTLAGTSATKIIDADALAGPRECVVLGIVITNHSGGALTPILDLYNGTTAYIIRDNVNLADTATETISLPEFYKLDRGNSIRITADSGLSWHVSYILPNTQVGA